MEVRAEARVVPGFRFAGVEAGLKAVPNRKDLGLIVADAPAAAAGIFTTNQVKAAPVTIAQQRLRAGRAQAIVANSGSANCFTGKAGMKLAVGSCAAVAAQAGCREDLVVPCSTGVIGHLYDLDKYRAGVRRAYEALAPDGLAEFAQAIMTTDTAPKLASTSLRIGGAAITIAGAAKGAGMIAPNMATLLAFIVTDAAMARSHSSDGSWRRRRRKVSTRSSVDGDMSTNDTLILRGQRRDPRPQARGERVQGLPSRGGRGRAQPGAPVGL